MLWVMDEANRRKRFRNTLGRKTMVEVMAEC